MASDAVRKRATKKKTYLMMTLLVIGGKPGLSLVTRPRDNSFERVSLEGNDIPGEEIALASRNP